MQSATRRAVLFGGTGVLGRAIARRLLNEGWAVDLVGRDRSHVPNDLLIKGGRFHAADRSDDVALGHIVGSGADLLVDALCYTANHARQLIPLLRDVTSAVMLSSKAVYVDEEGRHANSRGTPQFSFPIREDQPTVEPGNSDFNSREGYGANKVAAERTLLDSGLPVTVIRASKVHGDGAPAPLEWHFVKRVLDRRPAVFLAHQGLGANHTTAAANLAALVERVAAVPGQRILNSADPDAPNGLQIARTIAAYLGHEWEEILLEENSSDLGRHPWDAHPPIILDTRASLQLGYVPAGTYAETVTTEIDWLLEQDRIGSGDEIHRPSPSDYAAEDEYLVRRAGLASSRRK